MTRTERAHGGLRRWMGFALVAVMAFGAMAGGAAAHDPIPPHSVHGESTYLDERDGEPTDDIECQFWVKGTNVTHPDGTIEVVHEHPDTSVHAHTIGEWEGEPDGNGNYEFVAGPFQLHETEDDGSGLPGVTGLDLVMNASGFHRSSDRFPFHYEECENPDEHDPPPPPHCARNVKAVLEEDGDVRVTWDAAERAETYRVHRSGGQAEPGELSSIATHTLAEVEGTAYLDNETEPETEYEYQIFAQDGPRDAECNSEVSGATTPLDGPPEPPQCPADLTAEARADGGVGLNWQGVVAADSYNVYRATEDGDFEHVAERDISEFPERNATPGTTYRYEVTAVNEAGESQDCPTVEVTAVPFFGNPAIVAMAAIASVGAVAAVRTRRG